MDVIHLQNSFYWQGDSRETSTDILDDGDSDVSGRSEAMGTDKDELLATRNDIAEVRARQEAIEKERDLLLEELAQSEAKQQEYVATIMRDKEVAIAELEAAKALFNQKLEQSVEEKFNLESKLVLAKQDAVELAVQVEKLAEIAFQQATSNILEDAKLKVSAAETAAAEAAYQIEEQIRQATEGAIVSIVEQSKEAIEKALAFAETAGDRSTKAIAMFTDDINPLDEIAIVQSQNFKLQNEINNLESQLLVSNNEIDRLQLELEQVRHRCSAFELQVSDAEKALLELQESSKKAALQQEEEVKSLLEKIKKDAAERKKAASKAFKVEMEAIRAAIEAAKETAHSQDEAYVKRYEALQRSLRASEAASKMWRERAEIAEALLIKQKSPSEEDESAIYLVNGGRLDFLMDENSQKWKLLSDGPRREIPDWMARRIRSIFPKFPPRKTDVSEAVTSRFISLDLPELDEVWSIAQEKPKEGDTLVEHVLEKEIIENKRKALERALQRRTIKWQRTPEEKKLGVLLCLTKCCLLTSSIYIYT